MTPATAPVLAGSPDLVIIGGGIVGLWCARFAAEAGARVTLLDAGRIGQGASGGTVGALMPHQPGPLAGKKALQMAGLLGLPTLIEALEDETGHKAGYGRVGRLVPIRSEAERRRHAEWSAAADTHWPTGARWTVTDENQWPGWLEAGAGAHGFSHDTLTARVSPRAMTALVAVRLAGRIELKENTPVDAIGDDGRVTMQDGSHIDAGRIVVAAGIGSFRLAEPLTGRMAGMGVKGQSALFRPARKIPPDLPVIYHDGVYVIAHADGTIAVGSTSENRFDDPHSTDGLLDDQIETARAFCPMLRDATCVDRWAGVRPKHESRDPVTGPIGSSGRIVVASGGFKIGFAVAHLMAEEAVAHALGTKGGPWRDVLAAPLMR